LIETAVDVSSMMLIITVTVTVLRTIFCFVTTTVSLWQWTQQFIWWI